MTLGVLGALLCLVFVESALRLHRWRHAPLRLRLLYGLFLLSDEAVQGIAEINQRVERGAASSFDELFEVYAAACGKSRDDVERLFGFRLSWRQLNRTKMILRNRLHWHVGLTPVPGQRLRTTTITGAGTRSTGTDAAPAGRVVRRILLTGGSVAYGYGATADAATIAGRLQEHLNRDDPSGRRWEVVNGAFSGGNSFQELIVALQHDDQAMPLDYVVSISGYNDVYEQFGLAQASVSGLAQGIRTGLERTSVWRRIAGEGVRRVLLLAALRRWMLAYEQGPAVTSRRAGAMYQETEGPDIYPLW